MRFTFNKVHLEAIEAHLPERVVTSLEIEERLTPLYERLKLSAGRLELMTGIRERRFWPDGTRPSSVAAAAGRKAIDASGIDPASIDCVINASVSRDCLEPATANMVHDLLGLPSTAMIFDVSNACLGFLNAIYLCGMMIERGEIRAGLVTAGENGGPLVESTIADALARRDTLSRAEFKRMFASLTIGSGAAAAVLAGPGTARTGHRILSGTSRNATTHSNLCTGGGAGAVDSGMEGMILMETDSEELLVRGVELARRTWEDFSRHSGISAADVDSFFGHQVGSMHRKRLYETTGLPVEKDFSTFETMGNVGSVSLPATMAIGLKHLGYSGGQRIVLMGIGSGINCMMMSVGW